MRKAIVVAVSALTAICAVAASVATADSTRVASPAAPSCKQALIALTGPYTGAAASAGADQLNWGRIFVSNWNAGKPIPGVPPGTKRTKLKTLEADTALDAQLAATVAVQLRSNKDLLAVNGFSGSQENVAGGPILRRGGVPFVSGSATRASLTDPVTLDGRVLKKVNAAGKILAPVFFRRVVPTDKRQGATDAAFVLNKLGAKSGDRVMTVDQAEAYSVPLITLITQLLDKAGVNVSRESQSAAQTDFTSLATKAVAQNAKVVVFADAGGLERSALLPAAEGEGLQGRVPRHGRSVRLVAVQVARGIHLVVQPRHQRRADRKAVRRSVHEAVRADDLVRCSVVRGRAGNCDGDLGHPVRTGERAAAKFGVTSARSR